MNIDFLKSRKSVKYFFMTLHNYTIKKSIHAWFTHSTAKNCSWKKIASIILQQTRFVLSTFKSDCLIKIKTSNALHSVK